MLKVCQLTFFLFLFIHCLGCVWFFIARQNKLWIPATHFINVPPHTTIYEDDVGTR